MTGAEIYDPPTPAELEHLRLAWEEAVRLVAERRRAARWDPDRLLSSRPLPRRRQRFRGAAKFHAVSHNRKLSPVDLVDFPGQPRPRPIARRPFLSSTYASIEATCPSSCTFKGAGCFADAGFTRIAGQQMDLAARGRAPEDVIREEVALVDAAFGSGRIPQDGARGGRDLRVHVGGDVANLHGAILLGRMAERWRARGGGTVYSYTHHWREIPRSVFGPALNVLASIERVEDIEPARAQGYASALVVDHFEQRRAYPIAAGWKLAPCPAEVGRTTCAECRLCLDRDLVRLRLVIGFAVHGTQAKAARERLIQIRRPVGA